MKAVVYTKYGSPDVLEIQEIEKPTAEDDQILIRVRAVSINPYDWHLLTGLPYLARLIFGLFRPKSNRLGADFAGEVEAVGKNITQFRPGDEVFGEASDDAFSEFICVSEDAIALKPANLTFEQAASTLMVGFTALAGLRRHGKVTPGQKVLINGASGGVGTFAVQVAKWLGAKVTGVCSTRNVEMVRSLGADYVIDYTRENFTRGGQRYDLILDNIGNHSPSANRRVLNPKGIYLSSFGQPENLWLGPMAHLLRTIVLSWFVSQKMASLPVKRNKEDLLVIKELLESGKVVPVIDRSYPLGQIAEAMRYLEEGHARGKVVITIEHKNET